MKKRAGAGSGQVAVMVAGARPERKHFLKCPSKQGYIVKTVSTTAKSRRAGNAGRAGFLLLLFESL